MENNKLQEDGHGAYIRYISSDTAIATVNSKGVITGKTAGTCRIYVIAIDGFGAYVTVKVK